MTWTRRQYITQAFDELGYASYAYDLEPEQLNSAKRRLDSMLSTWNGMGIRLGFPLPSSPELSDLDEETGVPDYANEAIALGLAVRLAPSIGKVISPDTKANAKRALNVLLKRAAEPVEKQFPGTLPLGAGNKRVTPSSPFVSKPTDPIDAGSDGPLEFN